MLSPLTGLIDGPDVILLLPELGSSDVKTYHFLESASHELKLSLSANLSSGIRQTARQN